jgi:hypothetical protein
MKLVVKKWNEKNGLIELSDFPTFVASMSEIWAL